MYVSCEVCVWYVWCVYMSVWYVMCDVWHVNCVFMVCVVVCVCEVCGV